MSTTTEIRQARKAAAEAPHVAATYSTDGQAQAAFEAALGVAVRRLHQSGLDRYNNDGLRQMVQEMVAAALTAVTPQSVPSQLQEAARDVFLRARQFFARNGEAHRRFGVGEGRREYYLRIVNSYVPGPDTLEAWTDAGRRLRQRAISMCERGDICEESRDAFLAYAHLPHA